MRIYLAHPISGMSGEEIFGYYDNLISILQDDFIVLHPLIGKGELRTEKEYKAKGYGTAISSNHAIFERDRWMVSSSDIVLVDLSDTKSPSIGCMMELAWASLLGKHTIVVMQNENIHQHAFVIEAADIIYDNLDDAITYLLKLSSSED